MQTQVLELLKATVDKTLWVFDKPYDFARGTVMVALECKSYLIPGTARDWVPVSMVTSLIKSIQEQPGMEELVSSLQDLEQSLQVNTSLTFDKPPGFYGDSNMIDSPETMSVNSDACSHHMDSGLEDDDNLSINQGDIGGRSKKDNGEFSLENALFSVAVKAKRFAEERRSKRRFNLPNFRSVSSETESNTHELKTLNDQSNQLESPLTEELGGKTELGASEMSQGVPSNTDIVVAKEGETLDVFIVDSDDNESRGDDDMLDLNDVFNAYCACVTSESQA
ncbi:hypothetical protein QZH41_002466 [Actinostola sp. cb2023]|nr:hypothetical protein QZH41_002466 [Actinostola sp. cb2023]